MLGQPYASGADTRHVIEPASTVAVSAMRLGTNLELMVERSRRHSGEGVFATIVATAGSTYRRAGARMLLMADGNYRLGTRASIAEITANYAGNQLHSGLLTATRAFSLASAPGEVAAPEG
jgi:hypothetical protein